MDAGNNIDQDDWKDGYALYGFILQPQYEKDDNLPLINQASVRLEISFAQALLETVSCISYAVFSTYFEIHSIRNVIPNLNASP
jgi:hypothetical protein